MKIEAYIARMEEAWDEGGLLCDLRRGLFREEAAAEFLQLLRNFNLNGYDLVPKRLLSLMWFLPLFLEWQRERVKEVSLDQTHSYPNFIDEVHSVLQETLGVP